MYARGLPFCANLLSKLGGRLGRSPPCNFPCLFSNTIIMLIIIIVMIIMIIMMVITSSSSSSSSSTSFADWSQRDRITWDPFISYCFALHWLVAWYIRLSV